MLLPSPWRADFPAIAALQRQDQTYLDNAATTQKPQALLDALTHYYASGAANVHRAQHLPGAHATQAFENSRCKVAQWLNAADCGQIVFTHGATSALNLLAYGLEHLFNPGDEIVISALEHHANLLPWQQLAQRQQLTLVVLPLDADGVIDLDAAARLITPRTRLLAVSQLSNVLGVWQPLPELLALAKAQNALTVVDGAQGVVHGRQDVNALGCDFYVFSSHKLYGPDGLGVLFGRHGALASLKHWQFGGEMVQDADYQHATFRPAPLGFEAGTPPIASVIGLGATLSYLSSLDQSAVDAHEAALHALLVEGLQQRPGIRLLGSPQLALVSFVVEGVHNADLAHLLTEQGIAVRAGHHCAMPLLKSLGLAGAIRVSLALYNDSDDLQRFFDALDQALELLQ
ncbi:MULTISPECIES: aminotransferase class V-fold PLP-dependent enzyme [unclassified Pseudomonas]|uniref:aminotransferase class V-fold PLP-dependent enzyme n=1 Tax=unclassified Pseudomonas TaxID=196821 RepID=UPI001294BD62|nr:MULTISPECIES: cysteine desulfurase [unclassified Pseudomonas]MQT44809.1 aminotransferase class V-fold PLP-dependent enzyme [Pseudomonas sp. FSL R10-0765]MQT51539.1 aminotransferase class V-fold PLP-dependent enzyme [Pseudomonas sp. FSL R10-2398]MQU02060.1 aminotransferase class V-fold PLP-dependent enzyme [Pseudomonas sp. FSL R10-2245]MQU12692.1 aminotransferase class V-fold PLP-dependent enzyme [Pseudomonas sp. FSL R10-2189]MQU38229.1 aminotransferase class V-fold PLP-dependent enzyme [Pse